jgi:serine/threonine protein kinase
VSVTTADTATVGRNVPLEPGQAVGAGADCQWQVVRHIADGGFSSVYEVRPATAPTQGTHGPYHRALKCLWGTPAELTAIGGEAAKMAAVEGHENVLGLVDSFLFDAVDRPQAHYVGLVLELAAEDLRHFAARAQPSERAWAAVFEQVAAGLDHIHSRRVVHGDIKPTNVLRIGGRFAIADFGVAAPLETTRSAGIGLARTIAFWPPESASQGVLSADGIRRPPAEGWRATQLGDVWALAVSMHRVLTGRHITPGTTPEQQYELVCLGKYSIDDRLGPGWRQLLADCLAHDPDERTVSTAGALRPRLAELALADDFLGVPWTDGRPRVAAVLDLGAGPAAAAVPPDPPVTRVLDGELATPSSPRDGSVPEQPPPHAPTPIPTRAPGAPATEREFGPAPRVEAEPPTAVEPAAGREVLLLYLTQEGGRVQGAVVPAEGLLLAAARHLSEVAVPSLAQQVRDSQRAVVRLVDEHERLRARSAPRVEDEAARTLIVGATEMERTRELTVAVADVTRQRDRLAQDRDRVARHRDELAVERDRLRQQYGDLARRLDRLERDQDRRDRDLGQASTAVFRRPDLADPVATRPPVRGGRTGPDSGTDRAAVRPDPPAPAPGRPRRRKRRARTVALLFLLVLFLAGYAMVATRTYPGVVGPLADRIARVVAVIRGQG